MHSHTQLASPAAPNDAATKGYVDAATGSCGGHYYFYQYCYDCSCVPLMGVGPHTCMILGRSSSMLGRARAGDNEDAQVCVCWRALLDTSASSSFFCTSSFVSHGHDS